MSRRGSPFGRRFCCAGRCGAANPAKHFPGAIARYAVKRVLSGRLFAESKRSIDHPEHREQREYLDWSGYFRPGDDPAEIVRMRLDTDAWFAHLAKTNHRLYRVAILLSQGKTTGEVAKRFKLSPGRISQMRTQLAELYAEFTG